MNSTTVLFLGLFGVIATAPFEMLIPVVRVGPFKITNLEMALLIAFTIASTHFLWRREWPLLRTAITPPAVALGVVMLTSSLTAEHYQGEALRYTGRFLAGFCFFLLLVYTIQGFSKRLQGFCLASAIAGVVAGSLGIMEYLDADGMRLLLAPFQEGPFLVGGLLRVSSTLQYPTIASMYLEIAFGLGLAFLLSSTRFDERIRTAFWFAGLIVIAAAIVLTWTRGGLITLFLQLVLVLALYFWKNGPNAGFKWLLALFVSIALLVGFLVASYPASRLRVISRNHHSWYRAGFKVPSHLDFSPGQSKTIEVRVTNRGKIPWRSDIENPFLLSYHWLDSEQKRIIIFEGDRTPFPQQVDPGESMRIMASVTAPRQPDRYWLAWDIVQERRLWFLQEQSISAKTEVAVTGEPAKPLPLIRRPRPIPLTESHYQLDRVVLWKTAFSLLAESPLLGVGPGNFRLVYGDTLGLEVWNRNLHANNTYLDFLAGTGLLGGAAFLWLWVCLGITLRRAWYDVGEEYFPFFLGVLAAIVAVAVHGLVDHFFPFTPTYLMIWLSFGLAIALSSKQFGSTAESKRVYGER